MVGNSRQQTNTEIIMDTQTEVKVFVQRAVLSVALTVNFNHKVLEIIKNGLKDIDDEELKELATETLLRYANGEYQRLTRMLGLGVDAMVVSVFRNQKNIDTSGLQNAIDEKLKALPLDILSNSYTNLANSQAKVSFGQSLYGRAELQARYQEQQEMLNNLQGKTRLVICDTHSDCSDRCSKWQGRVYSLDGTSGTTSDGRQYIPLEVATHQRDKYGHINGLLGYNCRHKLVAYHKGEKPVKVNQQERKLQDKITKQQRAFERTIRNYKDTIVTYQTASLSGRYTNIQREFFRKKAQEYTIKVQFMTNKYREFCHTNNRVEYRSRLKI